MKIIRVVFSLANYKVTRVAFSFTKQKITRVVFSMLTQLPVVFYYLDISVASTAVHHINQ